MINWICEFFDDIQFSCQVANTEKREKHNNKSETGKKISLMYADGSQLTGDSLAMRRIDLSTAGRYITGNHLGGHTYILPVMQCANRASLFKLRARLLFTVFLSIAILPLLSAACTKVILKYSYNQSHIPALWIPA